MSAIANREQEAAVTDYSGGLLAVIERAAKDPAVDIEKLERLFALKERMDARDSKIAFDTALSEMQPKLPIITERGRIIVREKSQNGKRDGDVIQDTPFARWEDINEAIRPLLHEFGFALTFRNGLAPDGKVRVTTVLKHRGGHEEETHFDLPHDSSGSKNAVQAVGSSTSYAKRYGTLSILNITTKGEDDDGDASQDREPIVREIETPRDAPFPQGPAKNKTDLKAQGRDLWRDIESCGDADMIDVLLSDNKALIAQLGEALPTWWNGGVRDGEPFEGLRGVIERKQAEFGSSFDGWRTNPMRAG